MGKIIFAKELLIPMYDAAVALCEKHWNETEEQYRNAAFNPDKEQLIHLESIGWSRYFTARLDGELIGHLYFAVFNHTHTQMKVATEDFFYILPEHRKGTTAVRLLKMALRTLRLEGCSQIGMSSKLTGSKPIDPLLLRMGFTHVSNYYVIT